MAGLGGPNSACGRAHSGRAAVGLLDRCWAANVRSIVLLAQRFAERHEAAPADRPPTGRMIWFTSGQHLAPTDGEIAYAVSLPAWIFVSLGSNISGASPNSISFCLMLHFFLIFSCFIASRLDEERSRRLGEMLFVGALCLCVSLNSMGLVAGALADRGSGTVAGPRTPG